MTNSSGQGLTALEVLRRYKEEELPEFVERPLDGVNQIGNFGNYPIHVASVRGAIDELTALIEGGADVNATGERGNTPLHEAVGQEHIEAVRLLLDKGALRTQQNNSGITALEIARMHNRDDIVKLLT